MSSTGTQPLSKKGRAVKKCVHCVSRWHDEGEGWACEVLLFGPAVSFLERATVRPLSSKKHNFPTLLLHRGRISRVAGQEPKGRGRFAGETEGRRGGGEGKGGRARIATAVLVRTCLVLKRTHGEKGAVQGPNRKRKKEMWGRHPPAGLERPSG